MDSKHKWQEVFYIPLAIYMLMCYNFFIIFQKGITYDRRIQEKNY